ncbi:glutamate 5-kinase [Bacillaceae bacterium S4-13-58]
MAKQRIVVKIGSSSLTNDNGGLSLDKITEHVAAITALKKAGHEVIIISSGAVAAGYTAIGYQTRPVTLAAKQAAAAVGQCLLMQAYSDQFQKENLVTAQLLLTRLDFSQKENYQNAYSTLNELLKRGVIPIINENDSIAIDELTFGDNDMLSALVSGFIHANILIILTDINGLYDANPNLYPSAKKIDFLTEINEELVSKAGETTSKVGTGGMKSKIEAAKMALSFGVKVFIGKGSGENKLLEILEGNGDGTYIGFSSLPSLKSNKQWIGFHSPVAGRITVDAGAEQALIFGGKSLLPAGVRKVLGDFKVGDVVEVINENSELIGKGKVNFSLEELSEIKGLTSTDVRVNTQTARTEVIHRNHWVTLAKERIISE